MTVSTPAALKVGAHSDLKIGVLPSKILLNTALKPSFLVDPSILGVIQYSGPPGFGNLLQRAAKPSMISFLGNQVQEI